MITAVLDTNVLASGFVHPQPPPGQVLAAWRDRRFSLVVSDQILVELARTFDQPYFARHLTSDQRRANLLLLRDVAILTSLIVEVHGVATHREDDLILAAAVSAEADYLVTGDAQLQKLGGYQGVKIVSPREFVEALDNLPAEGGGPMP